MYKIHNNKNNRFNKPQIRKNYLILLLTTLLVLKYQENNQKIKVFQQHKVITNFNKYLNKISKIKNNLSKYKHKNQNQLYYHFKQQNKVNNIQNLI